MSSLSPAALIIILLACVIIAFAIGCFIGTRIGGRKSAPMRAAQEKHENYRNDVREHFEQTSAIMSRMVDGYRDMYQHLSEGAEKLADMHAEKQVTPPPAPEAITEDSRATDEPGTAGGQDAGKADKAAVAAAASEKVTVAAKTKTEPDEKAKVAAKTKAEPETGAKAETDTKADAKAENPKAESGRDALMQSSSANDRPWNKEGDDKARGLG